MYHSNIQMSYINYNGCWKSPFLQLIISMPCANEIVRLTSYSACSFVQILPEYKRAVVFRLGRAVHKGVKGPGTCCCCCCCCGFLFCLPIDESLKRTKKQRCSTLGHKSLFVHLLVKASTL